MSSAKMQHISAGSLKTSLPSRLSYVQSFLAFDESDGSAIQASASFLQPLIPTILDGIYTKLLTYDITASAFIPKLGHELDASDEPKSPQELTLEHPHIKRQMSFLRSYLLRIASNKDWSDESPLWTYMDHVAVMHTGSPGFKHRENRPELRVEYLHMALLLGYVEHMLINAVIAAEQIDLPTRIKIMGAWSKVLWIQNDLFGKYYTKDVGEAKSDAKGGKGLGEGTTRDVAMACIGGVLMVVLVRFFR